MAVSTADCWAAVTAGLKGDQLAATRADSKAACLAALMVPRTAGMRADSRADLSVSSVADSSAEKTVEQSAV